KAVEFTIRHIIDTVRRIIIATHHIICYLLEKGDSMMSFFYCMTCMATVVIDTRTLFTEIIEL
ncbi:MAG: hypothetical protein IKL51_01580, partial [Lachnospiraceae bacterium]|nr:hypothetical protein [Lachnospiraceae bacterium]